MNCQSNITSQSGLLTSSGYALEVRLQMRFCLPNTNVWARNLDSQRPT